MIRIAKTHLFALLFTHALGAQVCLDQSFIPTTGNGLEVTDRQSVQQTFTVGLRSVLTRVDLLALRHHRGISNQRLHVEVRTTSSGVPTDLALAEIDIMPSQIFTTAGTLQIPLPNPVCVQPGDVLAISLESLSPSGGATYAWGGDAPGGYANGECYIRTNVGPLSYDMGFETFVEKTPGLTLCMDSSAGSGSLRFRNLDGTPNFLYATILSFDANNAGPQAGTGPWGGLFIATSDLVNQLSIGTPPFLGTLDGLGDSTFTFPMGTIHPAFAGQTVFAVTRQFDLSLGTFAGDSNIATLILR